MHFFRVEWETFYISVFINKLLIYPPEFRVGRLKKLCLGVWVVGVF